MIDEKKLIEEIGKKLKFNLIHGACSSQIAMETRCKEEAYNEVLAIINSDKEESVSKKFAFKAIPRLLEMIEPTDRAKAYIAKLADTLEVEGYSTDAKIVRVSLKIMNGEKVPMATMDEEPVSNDLGEYINELSKQFPEVSFAKLSRIAVRVAKWQKDKMIKDAVDGKVIARFPKALPSLYDAIEVYIENDTKSLKEGDKVKVIVIKED